MSPTPAPPLPAAAQALPPTAPPPLPGPQAQDAHDHDHDHDDVDHRDVDHHNLDGAPEPPRGRPERSGSAPAAVLDETQPRSRRGQVQFNVYNFGQDAHTFAIVDPSGRQISASVDLPAGAPETAVQLTTNLAPGTYTLECTLPGHAKLGMIATLTVK